MSPVSSNFDIYPAPIICRINISRIYIYHHFVPPLVEIAKSFNSLHWRHNGRDCVLNHQPYDCLLNRLFRRKSKKTSKLRVTGLCEGNSSGTGEFPAQMPSNAENVFIWWRHHGHSMHIFVDIILKPIFRFKPRSLLWLTHLSPGDTDVIVTHWGRNKMAAIFQTTFSNAFSWMKMYTFRFRFHWSMFPWVQLTIFQHWFRSWLGAVQARSHYMNQWWLFYWRIYASLGLDGLN